VKSGAGTKNSQATAMSGGQTSVGGVRSSTVTVKLHSATPRRLLAVQVTTDWPRGKRKGEVMFVPSSVQFTIGSG
jgi:hypothetical protein